MSLKGGRRIALSAALTLAIGSTSLPAQQLRGVIRDSLRALPVSGAVVSWLDSVGAPGKRTISDGQGRFRLGLTREARRVQVLRIGFRPRDLAIPSADADGNVSIDVALVAVPAMLESVDVSAASRCPRRADGGQALALWEQARAGLLAAVVAREASPADVMLLRYDKTFDVRGERVVRQEVASHTGVSSRPFSSSVPAAVFATRGYMVESRAGRVYDGPDADVLLDESFADTHCFHVEQGDDRHRGQIGVGFDPMPGRGSVVDVKGVMWLDRAAPALRSVAFEYTALEPAIIRAGAGGSMSFHAMSNGVVFVDQWSIRAAILDRTPAASHAPLRYPGGSVIAKIHETGGEVARAVWPDGIKYEASLGSVRGRLVMPGTKRPAAGALAWLVATGDSAVADSAGAFVIDGVLPGPYTVAAAADPALAAARINQTRGAEIEVERSPRDAVVLEMRSVSEAITEECVGQKPATPVLVVTVIINDGLPAEGAKIEASWKALDPTPSVHPMVTSRSAGVVDADGRFRVCGVVPSGPIDIRIQYGSADPASVAVTINTNRLAHALTIALPTPQ